VRAARRDGANAAAGALHALPFALRIALVNPLVADAGLTVLLRFGELGPLGKGDVALEGLTFGAILGLRALLVVLASSALLATTGDPSCCAAFAASPCAPR
jgi:energy-coupling factor transporter transmembrane protein EcfT